MLKTLLPAFVFHGIGCCVTHLYVRSCEELSAISYQQSEELNGLKADC